MVVIIGGVAGLAATLVMSGFMMVAGRLGLIGEQPPRTLTRRIFDRKPVLDSEEGTDLLASATHLGFGAGAGAAFGLLSRPFAARALPWLGIAYGVAVWAGSYAGWIPALHLMQPPDRDRRERQAAMVAAHAIFGLGLGLLMRWLRRRADAAEEASEDQREDRSGPVDERESVAGEPARAQAG